MNKSPKIWTISPHLLNWQRKQKYLHSRIAIANPLWNNDSKVEGAKQSAIAISKDIIEVNDTVSNFIEYIERLAAVSENQATDKAFWPNHWAKSPKWQKN